MSTLKVLAANEGVFKNIRHPSGVGFRADDMSMAVDWPEDQFTLRLIRDGALTIEGEDKTGIKPVVPGGDVIATEGTLHPAPQHPDRDGAVGMPAAERRPPEEAGERRTGQPRRS